MRILCSKHQDSVITAFIVGFQSLCQGTPGLDVTCHGISVHRLASDGHTCRHSEMAYNASLGLVPKCGADSLAGFYGWDLYGWGYTAMLPMPLSVPLHTRQPPNRWDQQNTSPCYTGRSVFSITKQIEEQIS